MKIFTPPQTNEKGEELDLAALGQTWLPPQTDSTPEVSDILAETPWWVSRGLLYLIIGFVLTALLWAHYSVMDVVIEARGRLIPEGNVRPVQSAMNGVVQFISVHEGDTVTRGQLLLQLETTELQTRLHRLREELMTSEQQLRQLLALRGPQTETLDRQNRISQLKSELSALELTVTRAQIVAPVSGLITRLDVHSQRAVVQAGQQVAAISPAGARLLVEAQIPNKDVGLLETGLPAKLRFDAFPFQDYGTVPGTVIEISPDAQTDERNGSFYKVMIAPRRREITTKGRTVSLRPGLTLTAEIITTRQSVLSLLLEPFRKLRGEDAGIAGQH